ncbi:uncharacterized protein IAS62_001730 [Cryptococcus decagattii]|uniref:Uncharacterized protein n=1 Tax=Cryptococcus decagattii TaxID=1859122 RepID=A0ABZ2AQA2_9TREE
MRSAGRWEKYFEQKTKKKKQVSASTAIFSAAVKPWETYSIAKHRANLPPPTLAIRASAYDNEMPGRSVDQTTGSHLIFSG